ncbi:MAG: hypothetical protein HW380_866 [Magnetococcales bacterium]|nr:hypothetical protein [Magnetococcales bacterium]HIJ83095.1 hypothetical protein [Magnetococcales bacterium]
MWRANVDMRKFSLPRFKPRPSVNRHIGLIIEPDGLGSIDVVCGPDKPLVKWCDFRPVGREGIRENFLSLIKERKIKQVDCVAVLPMDRYEVFVEEMVPNIAQEEQADALRWNVIDRLDYAPAQANIVCFEQPAPPRAGSKRMAYVVATQNENLKDIVKAFYHRGKTRIAGIDIHELALRNIAALLPEDKEGVALLHLRANDGLLVVTRDHTLYLARKIEIGLSHIFHHLDQRQGDVDVESALKQCSQLDDLCTQVQTTLDYYLSRFMPNTIDRLYLAPMERPLEELRAAISDRLAVRVKTVKLEEICDFAEEIPSESIQGKLISALGVRLANKDCSDAFIQSVNFFDKSLLPKMDVASARQIAAVSLGMFLLAMVASGYLLWQQARMSKQMAAEKHRLGQIEIKVNQLIKQYPPQETDTALEKRIGQIEGSIMMKRLIVQILEGGYDFGNTHGFSEYFRELAREKLDGIWITRMRILNGGERFGLYGKSVNPQAVPIMVNQFQNSTQLSGHTYSQIKMEKNGVVEFSLLTHPMDEKKESTEKEHSLAALEPESPFSFIMEKFVEKALASLGNKD